MKLHEGHSHTLIKKKQSKSQLHFNILWWVKIKTRTQGYSLLIARSFIFHLDRHNQKPSADFLVYSFF